MAQRAKATLHRVRFSSGLRMGRLEVSPRLTGQQRRELEFWIRRLPPAFHARLPRLKLAVAEQLHLVRTSVFINEHPFPGKTRFRKSTHAASYIPERTVVLHAGLFRRRRELGRILYHEFCHFVWSRLGNPKRGRFADLLQREIQQGAGGELGYSSQWRKASLRREKKAGRKVFLGRRWREYVCESFCDTGSFILLGCERRKRHSEYTLSRRACERRSREWSRIVLERREALPSKRPETRRRGHVG